MNQVRVELGRHTYEIFIAQGLLQTVASQLAAKVQTDRMVIIADERIAGLYGAALLEDLQQVGYSASMIIVPEGEGSKSLAQCERLYRELILQRSTRESVILALGGGVTGDLAGFIAATYMRGIRFIQLPTTLLAQVDSSVGGKTGVNHELGKNLIGAFYQPAAVYIDPAVLVTLDRRECLSGMGEVVKYAMIADPRLFVRLEEQLENLLTLQSMPLLEEVIANCCAIKARLVSEDERETGRRALLNFGHTVGHAFEAAADFSHLRHGEAILRGMAAALFLSHETGLLPAAEMRRGLALLARLQPPPLPPGVGVDAVRPYLAQDKKRRANGQLWVLLTGIGTAETTFQVPDLLIPQAIRFAMGDDWT